MLTETNDEYQSVVVQNRYKGYYKRETVRVKSLLAPNSANYIGEAIEKYGFYI